MENTNTKKPRIQTHLGKRTKQVQQSYNPNNNQNNRINLHYTKRQRPNNSWLQQQRAGGSKRGRLTRKQKHSTRL